MQTTPSAYAARERRLLGQDGPPPPTWFDRIIGADVPRMRTIPMKIEPKTFFANERTFLHWLHMAVTVGSIAAALLGFAATADRCVGHGQALAPAAAAVSSCSMRCVRLHREDHRRTALELGGLHAVVRLSCLRGSRSCLRNCAMTGLRCSGSCGTMAALRQRAKDSAPAAFMRGSCIHVLLTYAGLAKQRTRQRQWRSSA